MVGPPVFLHRPVVDLAEKQYRSVLARAHVAKCAGLLAVARQASRRQGVERGPFGAASEHLLGDPGSPEDRLQRPDMEVLAGMGTGHDRQLRGREVEGFDATGLHECHQPERFHGRPEIHEHVRVAQHASDRTVDVDLDYRAAMNAFDDGAAHLAHKDRRRLDRGGSLRGRFAGSGACRTRRSLGAFGRTPGVGSRTGAPRPRRWELATIRAGT